MINIKVTSRMKHEDYVALCTASPYILPRKDFLGIGTTVLLCAVLVLPMPSTWRAFSGTESPLTAGGEAYLAADPNAQEQGVTHESNFKVQENYDDYDIPRYLFSEDDNDDDADLTASNGEDSESEGDRDSLKTEKENQTELAATIPTTPVTPVSPTGPTSASQTTSDSKTASTDTSQPKTDFQAQQLAATDHQGDTKDTQSPASTPNSTVGTTDSKDSKDSKDKTLAANADPKAGVANEPDKTSDSESASTLAATTSPDSDAKSKGDSSSVGTSDKKDVTTTEGDQLLASNKPDAQPSDTTSATTAPQDGTATTTPSQGASDDKDKLAATDSKESSATATTTPATSDQDKEGTVLAANDTKGKEGTATTAATAATNTTTEPDAKSAEAGTGEVLATTEPEPKLPEVRPEGTWYKHTIKSGDNLSGIFTHLNLPYATLNRITKVASNRDLRLDVGDPIYFLVDKENVLMEVVKNSGKTQQVRFTRLNAEDDFKVVYEDLNAHMAESALASVNDATQMPLAIEAQKAREARAAERKAREAKLLAERKVKEEQERQAKLIAEAKAKEAREAREAREAKRKALAEERRAKNEERKAALAANNAKSKEAKEIDAEKALEHNVTTTRPRLIINTIASGESFAKAAQRSGLTPREIATIKRIFRKQINVNKLRKGDKFRVLFTGVSTSSLISAVQIQTAGGKKFESFMNPEDRNYYGENEYTPTAGVFRRFPLSGSIQVNSQFDPQRRHPVTRRISPHNGVDFKAKIGTPVYAPADGVVSFSGYQRAAGYYIIVRHANNYSTVYMHLSKTEVKRDQKVRVGQVIARTGNTGRTTGPHLHYEVRINDHPVNPLKIDLPNSNQTNLAREQREAFANNVKVLRAELRNDRLALHRPI